jgi:DNA processing protein
MVAIVGARDATGDGLDLTYELAAALAERGVAVISGLARGIDAAAHRGALAAGGRTGAILGTPLAGVYPPEHEALQREVAGSLGLLSEIAPGAAATRSTFASRNRLLAAVSDAVVVAQGRAGSGALLTVAAARALGRPVGAVPWDPREPLAEAPLALLRAGRASLIRHADDVLALLPPFTGSAPADAEQCAPKGAGDLFPDEGAEPVEGPEGLLLAALRRRAEPLDLAARRAGLSIAEAGAALVALELRGRAERLAGGTVRRARGR